MNNSNQNTIYLSIHKLCVCWMTYIHFYVIKHDLRIMRTIGVLVFGYGYIVLCQGIVQVSDMRVVGVPWWRHQMETFSALLALCAGNSPVIDEIPSQRPVTRSFDIFFDLHLNTLLSKQSRRWWFETPSSSLWRHSNDPSRRCSTRSVMQ